MKIAIASENGKAAGHFGHCEEFEIFVVEDNKVIKKQVIANPGHKPGFLPNYLNELGVNIIMSGGMGGGAIEIFNQHNIKVITGVSGTTEDIIKHHIAGTLEHTDEVCKDHQHNC